MAANSPIEWTDKSWNPTRGCRRISPGCQHCYAERVAYRFSGEGKPYEGLVKLGKGGPVWTGKGLFIPGALDEPLKWRKPQMVFVNSMSDLFYEAFTNEEIAAVFGVMAAAARHTFQVLTKRPARAAEWFAWLAADVTRLGRAMIEPRPGHPFGLGVTEDVRQAMTGQRWPLPNVWLLTSVENQATADERIPHLLRCPAAVRGVSYEPALEAVDFSRWLGSGCKANIWMHGPIGCSNEAHYRPGLDWLIAGGESGPGARPCDLAWLRGTVTQARAAGVPVFVKQLGSAPTAGEVKTVGGPVPIGYRSPQAIDSLSQRSLINRKGGDMGEWPADLQVREFPGR